MYNSRQFQQRKSPLSQGHSTNFNNSSHHNNNQNKNGKQQQQQINFPQKQEETMLKNEEIKEICEKHKLNRKEVYEIRS